MLTNKQLQKMHTNQRLLVIELQRRGINVEAIFPELELVEASYMGHKELILDRDSSINPYAASILCGDKFLTKRLLERGSLQVPKGEQFSSTEIDDALIYAQSIGYPIVVKPVFGSHGDDVHLELENLCQVKDSIDKVIRSIGKNKAFIVEEHFDGKEYRVFVTRNSDYAVLHRDPAHVIGDGKRSIKELAEAESHRRMSPRKNCLCPITLDETVEKYLAKQGKDLDHVPGMGEKIYLRNASNVAKGGVCEDYTEKVHASVIELCKRVLDVFPGLPYAGVDFMSKDITAEQTPDMYRIVEVNSIPGVHMHMQPGKGKARDVAKYMADLMFPETKGDQ